MIDFRYHLVSLISVFLALAVGIALGAGPLEQTIGDSLTGQVDQLRVEKEELRAELDEQAAATSDLQAFAGAAGPRLVAGALEGRRVAVVALGEVDGERLAAIRAGLEAAGAGLTAQVTLTPAWTDPEQRSYRQALAGTLVQYLRPAPAADAGPAAELATALVQGLTRPDVAGTDALAADGRLLLELLSTGDTPLLSLGEPVEAPADAVVVVQPVAPEVATEEEGTAAPAAEATEAAVAIVRAAGTDAEGGVLADGPGGADSLTAAVLADGDLADDVTTVTGTEGVVGTTVLPLALAADIGGTVGHYGEGAEDPSALPPVVALDPPDRAGRAAAAAAAAAAPATDAAGTAGDAAAGGTEG
ncbi:copper transporter [Cellulomonas endophytica]|uniref:copper transporter n=1 Tax=Cellulomonas endophytica TaxID=2494735 RepID=UPI00101263A7|nr:copper transporter [Cellulomonas endophytica]